MIQRIVIFYVFVISSFTFQLQNASADEATQNETVSFAQGASRFYNDSSCPDMGRYQSLCCYHNLRYNCNYLREQFIGGYCRQNARDFSESSWTKCSDVPQPPAAAAPTTPAPASGSPAPGTPLPYATDLTNCQDEGEAAALQYARSRGVRSGGGYCAVGVRNALTCMFAKQGRPRTVHCGGAAYDYYGEGCLERMGFRRDMNMCNTPGVVRVYYGYKNRNSNYSGGDRYGHIEFLGTDRYWHAGVASSQPIDHPQKAGNRRILKACYVLGGS